MSENGDLSVRPTSLKAFIARYGSPIRYQSYSKELNRLPSKFPQPIQELFELQGYGSYGQDLIWTHPAEDFGPVIEEWTGAKLNSAAILARFSFGDFGMWYRGRVFFVAVHRHFVEELPSEASFFFDEMLCDDKFLDSFGRRDLHDECSKRYGKLKADECYAFVPALAAGGTETIESVQKAPLREHLAMLAQMSGPLKL